ncbi:MAG: hypothetical protein FJZ01_24085 [Candidatus Sericytochromatia bacterium]|nr:hypothetical protein [Candidatus Tanganyikabacteria bacterium]
MKPSVAAIAVSSLLLAACAGSDERIIDSSGSKPGWVNSDRDAWTENEKNYFRSMVDRQLKLDLAMDRARMLSFRKINENVYTKVLSAFGETTQGVSNDIDNPSAGQEGGFIKRELALISKSVTLQGVTQEASYWEKVRTITRAGEDVVAYKAYSLVSIPARNLVQAQKAATQAGLTKLNSQLNQEAKESATKALDSLKQELE